MQLRRSPLYLALSGLLALAASCGGTNPQAAPSKPAPPSTQTATTPAQPELVLGWCCVTPNALVFNLAQDKGFFKQAGVSVRLQRFLQGQATVAQALAAGDVDIESQGGPDTPLEMAAKGAKVKMIGTEALLNPLWLYVKPGIKSAADLKGKTVVVGGLGGPVYTDGLLMLRSLGLSPQDVHLIQNGNNEQRLTLLLSGQADASSISLPMNFTAEGKGFHALTSLAQVVPDDVEVWVTTDRVINGKRQALVRFLRAVKESQDYIRSHLDDAAAAYATLSKSSVDEARKALQLYAPYFGWDLNADQVLRVVQADQQAGVWKEPVPTPDEINRLIDTSMLKEAS